MLQKVSGVENFMHKGSYDVLNVEMLLSHSTAKPSVFQKISGIEEFYR